MNALPERRNAKRVGTSIAAKAPAPMTDDEWKRCLQKARRNSVSAILEFGRRMYEFQLSCEKKSGGTVFASRVKDWLSMSNTTAQCWVRIGAEHAKLLNSIAKLPASWGTIYEVCALPTPTIEKEINPNMTRFDVQQIIARQQTAGRRTFSEARRKAKSEYEDSSQREWFLPEAQSLGINVDNFPTCAELKAAIQAQREADAHAQQVWKAKAYAERYGDRFPDASDRYVDAEPTALHRHLAMPLRARLEWVEANGFNACVALGVPYGLAPETYRLLYRACEGVLQLDDEEVRLNGRARRQLAILKRAVEMLSARQLYIAPVGRDAGEFYAEQLATTEANSGASGEAEHATKTGADAGTGT
jgi:hypothetical protein